MFGLVILTLAMMHKPTRTDMRTRFWGNRWYFAF